MAQIERFESWASKAMTEGLQEAMRERLRNFFRTAAEPVIEEMVKDVMGTFEASMKKHTRVDLDRTVFEFILTDKRPGE